VANHETYVREAKMSFVDEHVDGDVSGNAKDDG